MKVRIVTDFHIIRERTLYIMIIIYIISFVLLGIYIFFGAHWISNQEIAGTIHELAVGAFGALLGTAVTAAITLRTKLWVSFLGATIYRFRHVRVSAAYLFKIYVDGKYLLVKGRNIDQYQPVGGVYKRLPDSSALFHELEILDDKQIPICDTTRFDLRVRVKGKALHKFLTWFDSGESREISHWREFCEELILPGILPQSIFPHVNYKFLYRNPLYIHHSLFYGCPEILIHDVYELIPNDAQLQALKQLAANQTAANIYRWVTEDEITRLGYLANNTKPFAIAEHSNSLFNKDFKIK